MMSQLVTDDVWRQLDPHAGRLSRRGAVRLWAAVICGLALIPLAAVLYGSGAVEPRIMADISGSFSVRAPNTISTATPATVRTTVVLTNTGWSTVTVNGVVPGSGGTTLTTPDPTPITIKPGQQVTVDLTYAITSCTQKDSGPFSIRVRRWWGAQTVSPTVDGWPDFRTDMPRDACETN
jgi:hypothetical protein